VVEVAQLTQPQPDHSEDTSNTGDTLSTQGLAIVQADVARRTVYNQSWH